MNFMALLLAGFGTVAGLVYFGLGLSASSHRNDRTASASDKFIGATLLWSLDREGYDQEGRRLCRLGNRTSGIACCVLAGMGSAAIGGPGHDMTVARPPAMADLTRIAAVSD